MLNFVKILCGYSNIVSNNRAGLNKAMRVGIFQKSIEKNSSWLENLPNIIKVQDEIRLCRLEHSKKSIRTWCAFIRLPEYFLGLLTYKTAWAGLGV